MKRKTPRSAARLVEKQKKRTYDVLPKPDNLIRYRQSLLRESWRRPDPVTGSRLLQNSNLLSRRQAKPNIFNKTCNRPYGPKRAQIRRRLPVAQWLPHFFSKISYK
jgi:hypothetical protein